MNTSLLKWICKKDGAVLFFGEYKRGSPRSAKDRGELILLAERLITDYGQRVIRYT